MAVWTMVGVEPHVCPKDLAQFCQGLFDCASRQAILIFSGKETLPKSGSKGSENSGTHKGFEVHEERVMTVLDALEVELPPLPGSCFFVPGLFLHSVGSLLFCKSQVIQEVIECGRCTILKVLGT